jgi:hypothetical protein
MRRLDCGLGLRGTSPTLRRAAAVQARCAVRRRIAAGQDAATAGRQVIAGFRIGLAAAGYDAFAAETLMAAVQRAVAAAAAAGPAVWLG